MSQAPHGMALVATLLCLVVIMLFAAAVVQALTTRHRASRWDERQLQCMLLVQSAVDRTKAQCAAEPSFAGETWSVSLDDRGVTRSGIAQIRVQPVPDQPQRRHVEIDARWPDDPMYRVQQKKQLIINLPAGVQP